MKARLDREVIALRAAKEFQDGDYVNLGAGIPSLCPNFVPEDRTVIFHSENGLIGYGPVLTEEDWEKADFDLINAGGRLVAPLPGMCFVDHAMSFVIARGGRLDVAVLGALQVSEKGGLANFTTGTLVDSGLGGAMDIAYGAKKVIVTMEHTTKKGVHKIVRECSYPLTCKECVDLIVTDVAVIEVTKEGLQLREVAPGWTAQEVQAITEAPLIISKDLKEIEL